MTNIEDNDTDKEESLLKHKTFRKDQYSTDKIFKNKENYLSE